MKFLIRHPLLSALVLFFFAIQLFSANIEDKQTGDTFSRYILTLSYYPQKFVSAVSGGVYDVWDNYIDLLEVREQNERLRAKINKLRLERLALWEAKLQNKRLRKLLDFKDGSPYPVVTANVIAGSPSSLRPQVVIVDKGERDGVKEGMPVANYAGVVGRVLLVGRNSSEVVLITDPISAVDSYVHRTRARGIVKGTGDECVMEYIEKRSEVSVGDKVISSGKDGFFPKGVVIGTVREIETRGGFVRAYISPDVDLSSLEEVVVILKSPESVVLNE